MAWVAFDRAVLLAEQLGYKAPDRKMASLRDTIHRRNLRQGIQQEKEQLRAGLRIEVSSMPRFCLMPLVGFLPPTDPRVVGHRRSHRARTDAGRAWCMRYNTAKVDDGLPPGEGVFLACSFWMVSSLKAIGRDGDARRLFNRLLGSAQRPGPALGAIRSRTQAPGRELPAGLLAYRTGQCSLLSGGSGSASADAPTAM